MLPNLLKLATSKCLVDTQSGLSSCRVVMVSEARNCAYAAYKLSILVDKHIIKNELKRLKWLLQKESLNQDVFLLGAPGSLRTSLALCFLETSNAEIEWFVFYANRVFSYPRIAGYR